MHRLKLLLGTSLVFLVSSSIIPFPSFVGINGFGSNTTVSTSCATALNATIGCDSSLWALALSNIYVSPNTTGMATTLCASNCNSSLVSYQNSVSVQCGSSPVINSLLKNSAVGDLLFDYYNLVCTKDPGTGKFCVDYLNTAFAATPFVSAWNLLPSSLICSACQKSYFQILQRSPFLGYNAVTSVRWLETQQVCGFVSPTAIDLASNLLDAPDDNPSITSNCVSGNMYTVKPGDSCQSVALANSVSQGTLWAINNLLPDCSAGYVGQVVCLPQTCTTYTLQTDDTCWSIASANGLTFSAVISYNPTINPDCSNLPGVGSVICISNPAGTYVPGTASGSSGSSGSGNGASEYATDIVPVPGLVPFGTASKCGSYYKVQVADTCERISIAAHIDVALFEAINPSIDADCTNLIPDLWYCAQPTLDWNVTDSGGNSSTPSITIAPPAPTPPGSSNACYQWHVVVSGDTCSLLQQTLGVSMASLMLWNPDLASDCSNLLLGEAYCVAASTSTVSTRSSSTSKASTSSSSTTSKSSSKSSSIPVTSSTKSSTSITSLSTTSVGPTAPTSVCVLGQGDGNLGGLCSFSCNFGYCPSPCTCTTYGTQIPPPAGTDSIGYPVSNVGSDLNYVALCSFVCSHGYCPAGACTTDKSASSVSSSQVCVAGISLTPNQAGLCSFACNLGYCPPPVCLCTAYGTQVPLPPSTGVNGVPLPGEDGSYLGLCSFACGRGYCPPGACTTA